MEIILCKLNFVKKKVAGLVCLVYGVFHLTPMLSELYGIPPKQLIQLSISQGRGGLEGRLIGFHICSCCQTAPDARP